MLKKYAQMIYFSTRNGENFWYYCTCTVRPFLSLRDEDDVHTSGRPKKSSPLSMSFSLCWLEGKEPDPCESYIEHTPHVSHEIRSTSHARAVHCRPAGRRESLRLDQPGTAGDARYHTPCTEPSKSRTQRRKGSAEQAAYVLWNPFDKPFPKPPFSTSPPGRVEVEKSSC